MLGITPEQEVMNDRLTALEAKLDRLLAHLEPSEVVRNGRAGTKNVASSDGTAQSFLLTVKNQGYPEAAQFSPWAYWLYQDVIVKSSGAQDLGPTARGVIGQVGLVKGLIITASQHGQSADAAVEFPLEVIGGHTCNDLCQPRQGLWFGIRNIEIT